MFLIWVLIVFGETTSSRAISAFDSLAAIKYAKVRVVRDDTGLAVDYIIEGPGANSVPQFGNNDDRVRAIKVDGSGNVYATGRVETN